ncbi:DUF4396 domain-containing protein [Deinococcus saxicola]
MDMTTMIPAWLTPLAWTYVLASVLTAVFLTYIVAARRPRSALDWVWPLSALFLGPAALAPYARWGRAPGSTPRSAGAPFAVALLSGAAASTIAHLIGVPVVFGAGWTIAGQALWAVALFILILATALLFLAEYATSAGHRSSVLASPSAGTLLLATFVTVLAFDIGMVGWMLYLHTNQLMAPITDVVFVFQMQVGMILGMLTAAPVVAWFTSRRTLAVAVHQMAPTTGR